ncbi:MAG: hypothetical protein V4490_08360, partial [Pseudomonadota bacterium]
VMIAGSLGSDLSEKHLVKKKASFAKMFLFYFFAVQGVFLLILFVSGGLHEIKFFGKIACASGAVIAALWATTNWIRIQCHGMLKRGFDFW